MTSSVRWHRSMSKKHSKSEQQVRELAEEGLLTRAEVARKAGVSQSFVRSILGPVSGAGGRPKLDGPLSSLHVHVGLRVSGWFTSFLTYPSLSTRASHFSWSARKQGQIERGTWELTLTDLSVLSELTDMSICELIGGIK